MESKISASVHVEVARQVSAMEKALQETYEQRLEASTLRHEARLISTRLGAEANMLRLSPLPGIRGVTVLEKTTGAAVLAGVEGPEGSLYAGGLYPVSLTYTTHEVVVKLPSGFFHPNCRVDGTLEIPMSSAVDLSTSLRLVQTMIGFADPTLESKALAYALAEAQNEHEAKIRAQVAEYTPDRFDALARALKFKRRRLSATTGATKRAKPSPIVRMVSSDYDSATL